MTPFRTLFLALTASLAAACAQPGLQMTVEYPDDPLGAEVVGLNRAMEAAFRGGDLATVAAFYADTGALIGPSGEVHSGREAIDAYWMRPSWTPVDWRLEVFSVTPAGPRLVSQTGRSHLTTERHGETRTSVVDFVLIWKRQPTGELRIVLDLYESTAD